MKECILATDLALFFGNHKKLRKIVDDSGFMWEDEEHRLVLMDLLSEVMSMSWLGNHFIFIIGIYYAFFELF